MAYHLLTVDHSHAVGGGVQLAPTVRLQRLVEDGPPGSTMPMRGDPVRLRLPDGETRQATILAFGLDGCQKDGYFYTASNPQDPQMTLSLRDLSAVDLPTDTEVWLPEQPQGSSPVAGPCSYCQMVLAETEVDLRKNAQQEGNPD